MHVWIIFSEIQAQHEDTHSLSQVCCQLFGRLTQGQTLFLGMERSNSLLSWDQQSAGPTWDCRKWPQWLAPVHSAVQTRIKGHMAKPPSPEYYSIIHPSIHPPSACLHIYQPAQEANGLISDLWALPPELEHPPRLQHKQRGCLFGLSCQVPQLVQKSLMALWPRREAAGRICPAASLSSSPRRHADSHFTYKRLRVHCLEFAHVLLLDQWFVAIHWVWPLTAGDAMLMVTNVKLKVCVFPRRLDNQPAAQISLLIPLKKIFNSSLQAPKFPTKCFLIWNLNRCWCCAVQNAHSDMQTPVNSTCLPSQLTRPLIQSFQIFSGSYV